ncbi:MULTISPECIES: helix-turn-helix domain-containing protein [Hydrocarboniphaga]|jgi:transcriptional regulator with XRE-family HTH domain|uniref:helix-turn-helix domain-containing protein n=1 Tax=Hydrocarboniphaga TaxID=243627 RepID=UPI000590D7E7|nr:MULTISPECIES: helix-turn-helix transcriptional regulator [Hydrocarboniphaga]MDZ4078638.1 helix-turn-helix transcriptional regulator [Hydrocarboniphaga sp.]
MTSDRKAVALRRVFGKNVRVERVRRDLSQEALAHLVATTQSHLSEIERGVAAVQLDMIARIADALLVEPMTLLDLHTGNTLRNTEQN